MAGLSVYPTELPVRLKLCHFCCHCFHTIKRANSSSKWVTVWRDTWNFTLHNIYAHSEPVIWCISSKSESLMSQVKNNARDVTHKNVVTIMRSSQQKLQFDAINSTEICDTSVRIYLFRLSILLDSLHSHDICLHVRGHPDQPIECLCYLKYR